MTNLDDRARHSGGHSHGPRRRPHHSCAVPNPRSASSPDLEPATISLVRRKNLQRGVSHRRNAGARYLATEAAVLVRYSDSDRLTAGAAPASVPRPCRPGPLLNAVEVEDLEAVGTVPGVSCLPHSLQTDHALRRAAAELLRQPGPQVATLFPGPTSHHPCPSPSLHHLLFLFMSVLSADGAGGGQTISHPEIWVWLHVTDAAVLS